jgi:hypothetical protein
MGGTEKRNVYKILIGIHERKRPYGRHRHRWEDNSFIVDI